MERKCICGIVIAVVLSSFGCGPNPPDPSYTRSSTAVYDAAILQKEFREAYILETLKEFALSECRSRQLARLIVSPSVSGLKAASNVSFPEADPVTVIRHGWFDLDYLDNPDIAQVLCFDGQVTAYVRHGDRMVRSQILGDRDARELAFEGVRLTLVGIDLNVPPKSARLPDTVTVYARVSELPDLVTGQAIERTLQRKIGIGTFLILRRTPFFVEAGGPGWDVFSEMLPRGSAEPFLDEPRMTCGPSPAGGLCKLIEP
jgi:hypothetical protein